jgi:hypothetical protein
MPRIAERHDLRNAAAAVAALKRGGVGGKIALTRSSSSDVPHG